MDNQLQKKGIWTHRTAYIKQQSSVNLTVVDTDDSSAIYITLPESCERRRIVRCWKKVERNYSQEQKPNQFDCYN